MERYGHAEKPVVMDKPEHHQELESIDVPGEGGYYIAFDGDKEVLVPKENLDAMKELVNVKMRRRADSKLTHYPDPKSERKELERFKQKIQHLKYEMKEYEEKTLEPLKKELGIVDEVEEKFKKSEVAIQEVKRSIQSVKSLAVQQSAMSVNKDEDTSTSVRSTRVMSEEISLPRGPATGTKSIKFLVSGHFRKNKRPIFIIRQYRGTSVLEGKHSDFTSSKTENGVNILISGKFYKRSILEEENSGPKHIRFKPHKKILIDGRSSIVEDGFVDLFPISEYDVIVGGMFVKRHSSPHHTPLVSIAIKRLTDSNSKVYRRSYKETAMSVSTPIMRNPFVEDLRKTQSVPKSGYYRRKPPPSVGQRSRGFKSLLTRIDEGEETFECPPRKKADDRSWSLSSTSTQNSIIRKNDEPSTSFTFPRLFSFDYFNIFKSKERTLGDEPKCRKDKVTSAPVITGGRINVAKPEAISYPSTSAGTFRKTEDGQLVPLTKADPPTVYKKDRKNKKSKKPGFFRRIFNRLFSR